MFISQIHPLGTELLNSISLVPKAKFVSLSLQCYFKKEFNVMFWGPCFILVLWKWGGVYSYFYISLIGLTSLMYFITSLKIKVLPLTKYLLNTYYMPQTISGMLRRP